LRTNGAVFASRQRKALFYYAFRLCGHYLDEFAESHGKDVLVRGAIRAALPSAGVACAIDREVLGCIADDATGSPFDPASMTEDYELGMDRRARSPQRARPNSGGERRA